MRLLLSLGLVASGVACAAPHSTGALWSQQYLEQEKVYFSTSDAQRRALTEAFELDLADQGLAAEAQRIDAALQDCPGPIQPLTPSRGDTRRDAIRVQAADDTDRLAQVDQLAQADWYLRRASAVGDTRLCQQALSARAARLARPEVADLLDRVPPATVARDRNLATPTPGSSAPLVILSQYALGSVDSVTAAAPLPQYLAWIYGGVLLGDAAPIDAESAAARVDAQAPAYPDWEPDALYAALRGGRP